MFDKFLDFIGRRKVLPLALDTFAVRLPDNDADEMLLLDQHAEALESISGIGCTIKYFDANGEESERRLSCRKLTKIGGIFYLQAFCHERDAMRTFRVDRISELSCGATGEVFDKPQDFLSRYTADESNGSASAFGLSFVLAADLRASLNIMAFIARSDGHFADSEATAVADFCTVFAERFATQRFMREGATTYARKLAPDSETFILALTRLKRPDAPTGLAKLVVQASSNLIQADGAFSEQEIHFGEQVFKFLDPSNV